MLKKRADVGIRPYNFMHLQGATILSFMIATQNSLPLEGKVAKSQILTDEVSWDSQRIFTVAFATYTSPPPAAEPLLKEKPFYFPYKKGPLV